VTYTQDLILLQGAVHCPWWRAAGSHLFVLDDLAQVVAACPQVVLLGCGYFGLVTVAEAVFSHFQAAGCRVVADRTGRVVPQYNRLAAAGHDVAACLHLTC
jgi:hypothetical protein